MGDMRLTVTKSLFVVSSKHVHNYQVASMVIPCRVDNLKVKCRLTYAVGCYFLIGVRPNVTTTLFCQEVDVTPPDIATFQTS